MKDNYGRKLPLPDHLTERMEQDRLIRGALGLKWNDGCEERLRQLLFTRRIAAKELQKVMYNSKKGQNLLELIKYINIDINILLIT